MLNEQERQIIQHGKASGKTKNQVLAALASYRSQVADEAPKQGFLRRGIEESLLDKTLEKTTPVLGTVFGGEVIGEKIGTEIARSTFGEPIRRAVTGVELAPEERELVDEGPAAAELGGDVLRTGALFTPIGRIQSGVARLLPYVAKFSPALARTLGGIVGGGAAGAAADVGVSLAEGETPELGLGTALGAGIPAAAPIVGALNRVIARGVGKVGAEVQGALTGTSAETIEQAFAAARTGGEDLERFTQALRGRVTPEQLVTRVRENVGSIASQRSTLFRETLEELGDLSVSTQPAKDAFSRDLAETGITVGDDGLLNFTKSKLRTVPNAQSKLQQAWAEVSQMPDELTIADLDTTRQAIKGIKQIAGDDPSANLANKLIDDAVRGVREAGEQVEGYGQMLDNFGETTDFLDELQRGLAAGDRQTIDQTYRRIATSLKTNNEQRMALVRELDNATDGAILSTISGQQLSEVMPRGIIRAFAASLAGFGAVTGNFTLVPLVMASPRVTGEFIRALGLGAQKTDLLIKTLSEIRTVLVKAGAVVGAEVPDNRKEE